ncbi:hypothetical protein vseg_015482 [Gypsophila vaccaria]
MVFEGWIGRKVGSILRPWVGDGDEPACEVQLGLFSCAIVVRNLRLKTSLLDPTLGFAFRSLTVDDLVLRLSLFSAPAFSVHVRGLNVALFPQPHAPPPSTPLHHYFDLRNTALLSLLDPQGSALHASLERFVSIASSKSGLKDSLTNLLLSHCSLHFHHPHVRLHSPLSDAVFSLAFSSRDLTLHSSPPLPPCLFAGFLSLPFLTFRHASFHIQATQLQLEAANNDHSNLVLSCLNPCLAITLTHLHLVDFLLSVPEISFSFSPTQIQVFLAFTNLFGVQSKRIRSGRLLWNIARFKLHNVLLPPKYAFYKTVLAAVLWLRLVKEYHSFLALVGYPDHGPRLITGTKFSKAVAQQWQRISHREYTELPVKAIATARQVARNRAALKAPDRNFYGVATVNSHFSNIWRFFLQLFVVWRMTLNSIENFKTFVLRMTPSVVDPSKKMSIVVDPRCCFHLRIRKVSASFSLDDGRPFSEKTNSREGTSKTGPISFFLVAQEFLFIYEEGICEEYASFSVGFVKIGIASVFHGLEDETMLRNNQDQRENCKENQTIAWGEPALIDCHSEIDKTESGAIPYLKKLSGEMELAWNRMRSILQESNSRYNENPWAICGIHTSCAHRGIKSSDPGFLKCNFIVGKLNIELGYSSVPSIATLIEQLQFALHPSKDPLHSSSNFHDLPKASSLNRNNSNTLKSTVKGLKMKLFKLLPDKHVEMKVFVAGPRVKVCLKNEGFSDSTSESNVHVSVDINFIIDVHNIYFTAWPTAMPSIAQGEHHRPSDDIESELFKLKENMTSGFEESGNGEYVSRGQISHFYYLKLGGLSACLENLVENDQMQVLILRPVTAKFSSIRDYLYSFGISVVASSLSLHGVMLGATGLFYMDELSVISQAVNSLLTAALVPPSNSVLKAAQNHPTMLDHQILQTLNVNEEILTGTNQGAGLTLESDLFSIGASFEVLPFDIILHNSRSVTDLPLVSDAYNTRMGAFAEPSFAGIWLSVQSLCISISVGEAKIEVDANVSGLQAVLFKNKKQTGNTDKAGIKSAIPLSVDCLYEASLSSCSYFLLLDRLNDSKSVYAADSETFDGNSKGSVTGHPLLANCQLTNFNHSLEDGFRSDVSDVAPSNWLLLNITVGALYMGPFCPKNEVLGANVVDKLQVSVSVGGEFQSILMEIQGGLVIIDMLVAVRIAHHLTSYLDFVKTLLYIKHSHKKSKKMTERTVRESFVMERSEDPVQRTTSPGYTVRGELLEACSIDLSHFSLVLLSQDESGVLREIIGRVTFLFKFWHEDRKQKFLFKLSHMEIVSQNLHGGMEERERNCQLPHFSSAGSSYESVLLNHENPSGATLSREKAFVLSKCASFSKPPGSMESSSATDSSSLTVQTSENCILEQLTSSISAEKLLLVSEDDQHCVTQGWVGHGSISGLNLTISLSEIKMLLAVAESLSEISGKGDANYAEEKTWSLADQIFGNNLETALPEGAIVAIQDVSQHMYVTVESVENKYRVAGAVHYSLSGRRALFRVKWLKQKRWKFSTSWFSLVSLYAKTASGDPLRLNYSTSSTFLDISSSNDSASALWKIASHKHEGFEDDIDLQPLSYLSRKTFYLVNKKNDSSAAFIHGAFEFVKKPGNPFKFKIFPDLSLTRDVLTSESHLRSSSDLVPIEEQNSFDQVQIAPCITLTVDKVSLTIVHELFDARDKLPLLQGSIDDTEITIQILPLKIRVISTFTMMLHYFDARRFFWREFVQPVEVCIYWRSTTPSAAEEKSTNGMHSRLFLRMQELDLSLSELSLDILLYLIGELDFAGPFAVKSSAILANCCKVENQLDLDLLCHFDDSQSARVGRSQSTFFFLRHLVDQPPEASHASVCLEIPGLSSTSSIPVPLGRTQIFAWRTRIKSLQDAQTHPGPFIVFDISKNVEEGLALTVSPLLRIHNQTGFPVELRIQRADSTEVESASVLLKEGDTVDDCVAAFDAVRLVGGPKKALRSLGVGNFVFSFRPELEGAVRLSCNVSLVDWSDNLEGGKAVCLSGVIKKFSYQFQKALSSDSKKYSFSTAGCSVMSGNTQVAKMHFLVQSIARDVPIVQPNDHKKSRILPMALQEQKEILLLPTVRVSNLLESAVDVLLSETETSSASGLPNINQATIPFGLTVDLYANPAVIFFRISLTMFGSSCKPVNCGQRLKRLNMKKDGIQFLDIDLEFGHGQYFACLRLARSEKGVLEAIIFTRYTLRNDTEFPLFCSTPNLKPLTRDQIETHSTTTAPHLGSLLPPMSIRSWFMKSRKLCMTLFDEKSSKSTLDLDALSGQSEMNFTKLQTSGFIQSVKLGISLGPLMNKIDVPARVVSLVPRYAISNESEGQIFVRQCFVEDDFGETFSINSKQRKALPIRVGSCNKQDITVFDKMLRKHKVSDDDFSVFVQFKPNESMLGWSGPVCVASLGCFFLKFKRPGESHVQQSAHPTREDDKTWEFAAVHVVEEASTFFLNFCKPPDVALPYRIENDLHDAFVTYYQKDTFEPEILASKSSVHYVWDDFTQPRKLVVKINHFEILREINLDKLRPWKPFFRIRQQRELASKLTPDSRVSVHIGTNVVLMNGTAVENIGYEVRADGPTRVLCICLSQGNRIGDRKFHSSKMIQLRVSYFAIRMLECLRRDFPEDAGPSDLITYTPIIVGRLVNISLDSMILDQRKYYQFRVQTMNVDEKWAGAPFAAMLRRHFTSGYDTDESMLFVVFVLFPTSSNVREVKFSSVVLQPIDLNLDEESLMKIVPFWRTSLSTNTQSQQYYFDHFEVHPVKIIASFLPEDSYSSYSSGQETLRSLLHSVIKIPAIKNLVVELNGVLVTHALVTTRELLLRCGRHYSWYAMRAVYIAKGSSLLPPAFASVFDDLASSSLDVFFDPSSSLFNVQGLTLGTFKLISKCIDNKGITGTRRYFGDLSRTLRNAGSSILFAAVTEVTDSVLKGAESSGFKGMVTGFHHGILKLAMEPSVLGTAFLEGGPDRKIKLDRSPGVDELYIEGYLQAMLDAIYKQEYLRVRVIDDQVFLKNLPPNSSLIDEILDRVKDFLVGKALLKGDYSTMYRPLRHLQGDNEWRIGPTVLTLCEHLFVSFAIRILRNQTNKAMGKLKLKEKRDSSREEMEPSNAAREPRRKSIWRWGVGKFVLSAAVAYIDGRLCRCIPNPVARRIVSGFLLSFLDNDDPK